MFICLKENTCLYMSHIVAGHNLLPKRHTFLLNRLLMVKIRTVKQSTIIILLHTGAVIIGMLVTLNILTQCPRCIIITASYINVVYLSAFKTERVKSVLWRFAGLVLSLMSILFIEPNDKKEDNRICLLHATSRFIEASNMASRAFHVQNQGTSAVSLEEGTG